MIVGLLYPDQDPKSEQALACNSIELTKDFELEIILSAMAREDRFILDVVRSTLLTSLLDPSLVKFRQDVLKDCLQNPDVIREIYDMPLKAIKNKQKHWLGIFTRSPSAILSSARELLNMYIELLKELRQAADKHSSKMKSMGFHHFFQTIKKELDDQFFELAETHLKFLNFPHEVVLSCDLGMGNKGTNYVLRKTDQSLSDRIIQFLNRDSQIFKYTLHPRDDRGARYLWDIRDKGLNKVANSIAQSADHIDSFFMLLRKELAFYIGCLNLAESLADLGIPFVIPQIRTDSLGGISFRNLFDISLALLQKSGIVGNDLEADGKNLVVITGANQGGKTTFLRSIGVAQLMMQGGMFVPAEKYSANIVRGIFTHFKREEDTTMESGRLVEELMRMNEIIDNLPTNSLILMNESFSSTNEQEGSEIARQITMALLDLKMNVISVTHLFRFANGIYKNQSVNSLFLRAERKGDGKRTYKMVEGPPLRSSFGEDLYQKIFG